MSVRRRLGFFSWACDDVRPRQIATFALPGPRLFSFKTAASHGNTPARFSGGVAAMIAVIVLPRSACLAAHHRLGGDKVQVSSRSRVPAPRISTLLNLIGRRFPSCCVFVSPHPSARLFTGSLLLSLSVRAAPRKLFSAPKQNRLLRRWDRLSASPQVFSSVLGFAVFPHAAREIVRSSPRGTMTSSWK